MKVRLKKALSLLLSLIMILGCMSLPAFAEYDKATATAAEAVASITRSGVTYYYSSLTDAIGADRALGDVQDYDTVVLLKNVNEQGITVRNKITLVMGEYSINGDNSKQVFSIQRGGELRIEGGTIVSKYTDEGAMYIAATGKLYWSDGVLDNDGAAFALVDGGICEIVNCTIVAGYGLFTGAGDDDAITVRGGTITTPKLIHKIMGFLAPDPGTLTVTITGGTFLKPDNGGYLSVADYLDNTKYVQDETTGEVVPVVNNVAQIGGVGYPTLADAIAAVPTDGTETTITMIADETLDDGITVAANQNIVLELNGKKITETASKSGTTALITNKGTLTIQDNTDTNKDGAGTGKISYQNANPDSSSIPGYASNTIINQGTLTIESGYVENTTTGGYAAYTVDNLTNGSSYTPTFTMNGGKLYNSYTDAVRMFLNSTSNLNKVVINGGILASNKASGRVVVVHNANAKANQGELDITGGTILGKVNTWSAANADGVEDRYADIQYEPVSINISGGVIKELSFVEMANETLRKLSLVVTGGTFNVDPTVYVAEGYEVLDNLDPETKDAYPYTVGIAAKPVAQIGDAKYETLAEAVAAVPANNTPTTIQMIADYEAPMDHADSSSGGYNIVNIAKDQNVILDLNGKTITGVVTYDAKNSAVLTVSEYGTLTIRDTSAAKTGTITHVKYDNNVRVGNWSAQNWQTDILFNHGGTLTIEGGTIANTANGNICYAIDTSNNYRHNNATLTITGGTITSQHCDTIRMRMDTPVYGEDSGRNIVNISGGSISGKGGLWAQVSSGTAPKGSLTITGGSITGGDWGALSYTAGSGVSIDDFDASISGGKIKGSVGLPHQEYISGGVFSAVIAETSIAEGFVPVDNTDSETSATYPYTVGIAATPVAQIGDVQYESLEAAFAAAQDGNTITLLADCETGSKYTVKSPLKLAANGVTLDLDGHTITTTGNFSFVIESNNAVVKNGSIISAVNDAKATKLNSYVLVINSCDGVTIDSITTRGGISVGGSQGETPNAGAATNVTLKNCTVLSGDYYAVCSQFESDVTIESGTYEANAAGKSSTVLQGSFIGTDGPEGNIIVTGGEFIGRIKETNENLVVLKGGVYNVDPSTFVADGYEAKNVATSKWVVGLKPADTNEKRVVTEEAATTTTDETTGAITSAEKVVNYTTYDETTGEQKKVEPTKITAVKDDDQNGKYTATIQVFNKVGEDLQVADTKFVTSTVNTESAEQVVEDDAILGQITTVLGAAETYTPATTTNEAAKDAVDLHEIVAEATGKMVVDNKVESISAVDVRISVEPTLNEVKKNDAGQYVLNFDFTPYATVYESADEGALALTEPMKIDNDKIKEDLTFTISVPDKLVGRVNGVIIKHNGAEMSYGTYGLSDDGRTITITTNSFSPYEIALQTIADSNMANANVPAYLSLTLEGKIGVNLYMTLTEAAYDGYLKVSYSEDGTNFTEGDYVLARNAFVLSSAASENSPALYRYTYTVSAKDMDSKIKVQLYDSNKTLLPITIGEKKYKSYTYSVNTYLGMVNEGDSDNLWELAQAMLNYGKQASYSLGKTSVAPNLSYADATETALMNNYGISVDGNRPGDVTGASMTLLLQSETTINVYFYSAGSNTYSFEVDGVAANAEYENGAYVVSIPGITAKNLNKTHSVTISDGSDTLTLKCSALTWGYLKMTDSSVDEADDLAKALYEYSQAAQHYTGWKNA